MPQTEASGLAHTLIKTLLVSLIVAGVSVGAIGAAWWEVKPHPPTGTKLAITLAQNYIKTGTDTASEMLLHFLGMSQSERTDELVQGKVEKLRGEVAVKGWTASEVEPDTYLVSFKWSNAGEEWGMYFEVNTASRYVRAVIPDDALAMKYGVTSKEEYAKIEAGTKNLIEKKLGNASLKVSYADHVLTATAQEGLRYDASQFARALYQEAKPLMEDRKDQYLKVSVTKGTESATFDGSTGSTP